MKNPCHDYFVVQVYEFLFSCTSVRIIVFLKNETKDSKSGQKAL